jgi:hypothetical protein
MELRADLTNDDHLETIRKIHDNRGGPRSAYAWAIGREELERGVHFLGETSYFYHYLTEDLDTGKVTDFIIDFYNAYNKRFGITY